MSAFVLQNICAVNERKQGHLVLFHGAVNSKIHEHFSKTKQEDSLQDKQLSL